MTDPLSYRLGGRGTGRTTRLVKATPPGGLYVVNSQGMCGVIKGYLDQIGRSREVEVIAMDKACMLGRSQPLAIDHLCFDEGLSDDIRDALYNSPLVLTNDFEGDVIVSYKEMN